MRNRLKRLCLWGVLAAWCAGLVACAPELPRMHGPAPALSASYAAGFGETAGSSGTMPPGADVLDWRVHFQDPELRRVLDQALDHSGDLRLAVLRAKEARTALGLERAERWPTLVAALGATRTAVPADLNVTRRAVIGNQFQVGLGLSNWEVDFWGRVESLGEAALQTALAGEAAQRAALVGLVAQVSQTYLGLRELDERLSLASQALDSRAETLRIFRRRVELGAASRLDLAQVELLWRQAEALVAQLHLARAQQVHALDLLVGAPVRWNVSNGSLEDLQLAPALAPGLPSDLLTLRPDIVASEHALQSAQAQVSAARAAFFPRIALTTQVGSASAELEGLFRPGSRAWTFVPSVSLPIFDAGRLRAVLDLSVLRREQAVVRYEQAVQAAFRDVADALAAGHWLAQQAETLRAMVALQAERSRLARLRYESGAVRYLEVLDAERDWLATQQQRVQLRRAQLSAQVGLWAALGGGVLEPPRAAPSGNPR
jgi:outer membrane protein, multidrug efflux system